MFLASQKQIWPAKDWPKMNWLAKKLWPAKVFVPNQKEFGCPKYFGIILNFLRSGQFEKNANIDLHTAHIAQNILLYHHYVSKL